MSENKVSPKVTIKRVNTLVHEVGVLQSGVISNVEFGVRVRTIGKGRDKDDIEYDALDITVDFEGAVDPIGITLVAGTSFNPKPKSLATKEKGKNVGLLIYNRFTTLLIKLNIVPESELSSVKDEDFEKFTNDILELKGRRLECELESKIDEKNPKIRYTSIKIETIHLLD